MNIDYPFVSLAILYYSLYGRRFALKDDYHQKRKNKPAYTPVEFKSLEILVKICIILAAQNQIILEKFFDKDLFRRNSIAMSANSAFAGPYTETLLWYYQFRPKQKNPQRMSSDRRFRCCW